MSQVKLVTAMLLLAPFVAKNQEIYKDDPRMLAKFDNLTLDDLEIGPVTKVGGVHSAHIKSATRSFQGPAQKWRPVSVHSHKVTALTSEEVLEDRAAALGKVDGGVFSYLAEDGETKHIIVLVAGLAEEEVRATAMAALNDALKYDVPDTAILFGDNTGTIVIDSDFIVGEIEYVVAQVPVDELKEDDQPLDLDTAQ